MVLVSDPEQTGNDQCQLCSPRPGEDCEYYALVNIEDPYSQKSGEVRVCLEHYEAIEGAIRDD